MNSHQAQNSSFAAAISTPAAVIRSEESLFLFSTFHGASVLQRASLSAREREFPRHPFTHSCRSLQKILRPRVKFPPFPFNDLQTHFSLLQEFATYAKHP
jgi:hypothetical protein